MIKRFAKASFKVDQICGDYPKWMTWNMLSKKEKKLYLDEAKAYQKLPKDEWIDFNLYGVKL